MKKKLVRRALIPLLAIVLLVNIVAAFHAYKFTHFAKNSTSENKDEHHLSFSDKISMLLTGVNMPKPSGHRLPTQKFETIQLQSGKKITCWMIRTDSVAKGTVILFHGYGGEKSSMLDKANILLGQGYNTMLVDFMGAGQSEGYQTTIGFKEAKDVKTCYDYLQQKQEKNIILFGTSMGAVAIMKAINDYALQPSGIIIECPFGTMYQTVCARFKMLHVPSFPMAGLLLFWGSIENGFWGFSHNPETYAAAIKCPALLLYGEKDEKVSCKEINAIYNNLSGLKILKTYPYSGHENYLQRYREKWTKDVDDFLKIVRHDG